MTQSLRNNGIEKNTNKGGNLTATPKWICGEDFKPRPKNKSGLDRVELARDCETGTHMTVVYDYESEMFTRIDDASYCKYSPSSLEIRINEING